MADPLDIIQKLIALALNNPSREEAMSAALKAVSLIVEKEVTLGGRAAMGYQAAAAKAWAPDAEFDAFWEKMNRPTGDPDAPWEGQSSGPSGLKVAAVDTDLDDDFMRKRITYAWRAIRKEREKLKTEIYNFETRFSTRYARPDPKDWTDGET